MIYFPRLRASGKKKEIWLAQASGRARHLCMVARHRHTIQPKTTKNNADFQNINKKMKYFEMFAFAGREKSGRQHNL